MALVEHLTSFHRKPADIVMICSYSSYLGSYFTLASYKPSDHELAESFITRQNLGDLKTAALRTLWYMFTPFT